MPGKRKLHGPIVPAHAPIGGRQATHGGAEAAVSKAAHKQGLNKPSPQQQHHSHQQQQQNKSQKQNQEKQPQQKQQQPKQQQQNHRQQQAQKQQAVNGARQTGTQPPRKKQRTEGAAGRPVGEANQKGQGPHQQQQQQQQQHKKQQQQQQQQQQQTAKPPKRPQPAVDAQPLDQQPPQQPTESKKAKKKFKKRKQAASGDGAAATINPAAIAAVARALPGSNWQALKQQLAVAAAAAPRKRRPRLDGGKGGGGGGDAGGVAAKKIGSIGSSTTVTRVVALDCEFVGVGPKGDMDALARVSVVNDEGNVLVDTFVAVKERVTNYRTWVSGVRPQDLEGAPSLEEVQERVAKLAEGRVLVGHSLSKDLKVLLLSHPRRDIRDTAKYPPLMYLRGGKRKPQSLKQLSKTELGLEIQSGEHSSVDDARAALYLYHKHRREWERATRAGAVSKLPAAGQAKRRHAAYGSRDVHDDPMADL